MNSAHDFTLRLQDLLRREHDAMADFLVALADFDERRLWMELGYASLFDFLHRELGLSKASASFRKKAAELVQRFPEIVEPLRDGRLCLSSLFEVAKVLTPENRHEILPRFFQLGKREAKAVAAALRPDDTPPLRELVTAVRHPTAAPAAIVKAAAPLTDAATRAETPAPSLAVVCPAKLVHAKSQATPHLNLARASTPEPPASTAEPLTADLNRLHVTVSRRFLEKLGRARAALSHSHPGGSMEEILEAGLDLLLDRHAKRNGRVKKPRRQPSPSSDPDRIPAHVRRAVWERDGGRCQWPVASGGACGSTVRVELHHETSRARGGPPTAENLLTLCDVRHDLATRREFGDALVDEIARRRRRTPRRPCAQAEAGVAHPPA
jgi:5-methylcytosine-specific restriction endonuclease McrA